MNGTNDIHCTEAQGQGKSGLLEEIRTFLLRARRAEYCNALIRGLSGPLSREFGKSLDACGLRRMRQFYLTYPIRDAVRPELERTHYRQLFAKD